MSVACNDESLDPRNLFTDSVRQLPAQAIDEPLDLVELGAPESWRPPPPSFRVATPPPSSTPTARMPRSEVVSTLGAAHVLGAAIVVGTAAFTSALLYFYFH